MPRKVVVTGVSGLRNRGVEALLRPVLEHLSRKGHEVSVLTRSVEYDQARISLPGVSFEPDPFFDVLSSTRKLYRSLAEKQAANRRSAWPAFGRDAGPTFQLLRSADAVIAMGGDVFSSDYGDLGSYLAPLDFAQRTGIPIMFLGHSVGPFHAEASLASFKAVAQHAAFVTARESVSEQYLLDQVGIAASKLELVPDPAFLLSYDADTGRQLAQMHGINLDKPVIVLCPSQGISGFGQGSDEDAHLANWRTLVRDLPMRIPDATLVLLAHVQEVWPSNDDRVLVSQLAESAPDPSRIRLVTGDFGAREFKSLISLSDLVVSERMHAAIAGLSSGVPTVPVAYSVKTHGIMGDLELSDCVITVDDLNSGTDHVLAQWDRRDEIAKTLRSRTDETRSNAVGHLDAIDRVLAPEITK